MSRIEWTEATWNPVVGCSIVSPGCTNCYAMKMAARIEAMGTAPHYTGNTRKVNGNAVWTGKVAEAPWHIFDEPRRARKPRTYFVNSMGDLYHEGIPDSLIDRVHNTMLGAKQHTYQVLTKRSRRMREYWSRFKPDGQGWITRDGKDAYSCYGEVIFTEDNFPPKGWWLGVSAERQQEADERIPDLLATPAAVRFISAEPLLAPLDLRPWLHQLGWVIVGGESGPDARPMHPQWARDIRDQCQAAGVAFFFKQWGQWQPFQPPMVYDESWERSGNAVVAIDGTLSTGDELKGGPPQRPLWCRIRSIGKAKAGRLLDGREWSEMPASPSATAHLEPAA